MTGLTIWENICGRNEIASYSSLITCNFHWLYRIFFFIWRVSAITGTVSFDKIQVCLEYYQSSYRYFTQKFEASFVCDSTKSKLNEIIIFVKDCLIFGGSWLIMCVDWPIHRACVFDKN